MSASRRAAFLSRAGRLVAVACLGLPPGAAALAAPPLAPPTETTAEAPARYYPRGKDAWDYWFARAGDVYHAFYLQAPTDAPVRFAKAAVGMATSTDLLHWTEYGEVLSATPDTWNDASIATGSTWRAGDRWKMLFTGLSTVGIRGVGLAESDDLFHWTKVGDGPLVLTYHPFVVPVSSYWQEKGFQPGIPLTHHFLADPYVYPEPVEGWYYMVANCLLDNTSLPFRGCIGMFRSVDGVTWEDQGIVAAPMEFNETEAPQLFRHGDRWYLEFGAARYDPLYRATMVYHSDSLRGPYVPGGQVTLPDRPGFFYGGKIFTNPHGQDVLMGYAAGRLSRPYPVIYESDRTLTLALPSLESLWVPAGLAAHRGPVVSDLAGGVISNGRTRLNANGFTLWGPLAATHATRWAEDGRGGAVGAMGSGDIRAVRTRHDGARPWGDSLTVCDAPSTQTDPAVCGDGAGGAFYAWIDHRNGADYDVYVQHLDSLGTATWTADGTPACRAAGDQTAPVIAPDGAGGVIVAWHDRRPGAAGGSDVYAQRIDAAGAARWGMDGLALVTADRAQLAPAIAADGAGGAWFAWWDERDGTRDVFAQRVDAGGATRWATDGVRIATGREDQQLPVFAPGDDGDMFVAWEDHRIGISEGLDIFGQRLAPDGAPRWAANGVPVCDDVAVQTRPSVVPDGSGGVIVAWMDARDNPAPAEFRYAPYAQRLDANGARRWTPDGVRIDLGTGTTAPAPPSIAGDGVGGVYVAAPSGLQRVLPDGRPAWVPNFTPGAAAVEDVAGDEGGFVRIRFAAPLAETAALDPRIAGYEVWRKPGPGAGAPPGGWDLVSAFLPNGSASYSVVVPTRADSGALGCGDEEFVVAARTTDPALFLPGAVVSGHSRDDLAPAAPAALAGGRIGPAAVRLVWSPGGEADLARYRVYRGTDASFPATGENRIGEPGIPAWDDHDFVPGISHYQVTAVDRHGNESAVARLAPDEIQDRPPGPAPAASFLARPAPNPAASGIAIEFGLERTSRVALVVYDLGGRRVRELVRSTLPPGVWRSTWDGADAAGRRAAAGLYLVRLVADGIDRSEKVLLNR